MTASEEYVGPVCRHVCLYCGGCSQCCVNPEHLTAAEAEAQAEVPDDPA